MGLVVWRSPGRDGNRLVLLTKADVFPCCNRYSFLSFLFSGFWAVARDEHTAHQNALYSLPCPVGLWGVVCSYDLLGSWLNSYPRHGLLPDSPFCLIIFSVQAGREHSSRNRADHPRSSVAFPGMVVFFASMNSFVAFSFPTIMSERVVKRGTSARA